MASKRRRRRRSQREIDINRTNGIRRVTQRSKVREPCTQAGHGTYRNPGLMVPSFVSCRLMFGVLGYLRISIRRQDGSEATKKAKETVQWRAAAKFLFTSLSHPGCHPQGLPQPVEPQTASPPGRTRTEAALKQIWLLLVVQFHLSPFTGTSQESQQGEGEGRGPEAS